MKKSRKKEKLEVHEAPIAPPKKPLQSEEKIGLLLSWKRAYEEAMCDYLKPEGDVLQVGFSRSLSERIQTYPIKSHTVIETRPFALPLVQSWLSEGSHRILIQGAWREVLPKLGVFDALFFNEYPLGRDMVLMNYLFPEETLQATERAKNFLDSLTKQREGIKRLFSDQEIEEFYLKVGQFNQPMLPLFFKKLQEGGNITQAQYQKVAKKYHLNKALQEPVSQAPVVQEKEPLLLFLEECLKSHTHIGSLCSWFLVDQKSKYEDTAFFESIITNVNLDYKEDLVTINLPNYTRQALVVKLRKSA